MLSDYNLNIVCSKSITNEADYIGNNRESARVDIESLMSSCYITIPL